MTCGRQGILKTARESGSVACSLVGVRFAEDLRWRGQDCQERHNV